MSDVEVSSLAAAPVEAVWDRIASFDGVNHELDPRDVHAAPRSLARTVVRALFRHRHRRLSGWFSP